MSVSVTTTLPVGVPVPGRFTETEYWRVTAWPDTDGAGVSPVTEVVVDALVTVWASTASGRWR